MFWGCVSGVRGHHAKLSLAADAESVREIWAVIWTPAFRFDDGVPLTGQAVEKEKAKQKCGQSVLKFAGMPIFIIIIHPHLLPASSFWSTCLNCTSCSCFSRYYMLLCSLVCFLICHHIPLPHLLTRHLYLHVPILFCIHLLLFYAC